MEDHDWKILDAEQQLELAVTDNTYYVRKISEPSTTIKFNKDEFDLFLKVKGEIDLNTYHKD